MRLPEWIRNKYVQSDLHGTKSMLRKYGLSTVCEEARCPNKGVCFRRPTATFMILGHKCTRDCGFCAVSSGKPSEVDLDEPRRIALAAKEMGLRYIVVTSVTRDDLQDGGALQFAMTIRALKAEIKGVKVEVLTPDFGGDTGALRTVLDAGPDVFNHNVETVPRLYPNVRPKADYRRSINMLRKTREITQDVAVKSGLMLGLGESFSEVLEVLADLRNAGCDLLTIGQYLRPTRKNLKVTEYVPPETFERFRTIATGMGFRYVASFPLARSSMNAEEMYELG
jgi:lipoic acid synthetase